jgi:hypothetical protein
MAGFMGSPALILAGGLVHGPIGELLTPVTREFTAAGNSGFPNLWPPAEALIHAYVKKQIDPNLFFTGMLWNGVSFNQPEQSSTASMWTAILNGSQPTVPADSAFCLYGGGQWTQAQWQQNLNRSGIVDPIYQDLLAAQQYAPQVDDVLAQQWLGLMTPNQANSALAVWGLQPGDKLTAYSQLSAPPGVGIVRELLVQGRIQLADAIAWVKASGWRHDGSIVPFLSAGQQNVPSVGQLITLATSGATDAAWAAKWGLYYDIPPLVTTFADRAGGGYKPIAEYAPGSELSAQSWASINWAASRNPVSPAAMMQMYFRFRPGRQDRYVAAGLRPPTVTLTDCYNAFIFSGFTLQQGEGLAGLSFKQLSRFDIRGGLATNVITEDQAAQYYQDLGYLPDDAQTKVKIDSVKALKLNAPWLTQKANKAMERQIDQIIESYMIGTSSAAAAVKTLILLGYSQTDAQRMIDVANWDFNAETVQAGIKSVEQSFLHGEMSAAVATASLAQLGLQPDRAAAYLQRWILQHSLPKKTATAAQNLEWLQQGLLDANTVSQRLTNLGIDQPDVVIMVTAAKAKMDQLHAKQSLAQAKQGAARARELQRLANEHAKQVAALGKQTAKIAPVATLMKWLAGAIISPADFTIMMEAKGYGPATITDYIKQAAATPAKVPRPAAGQPQPPEASVP